MLLRREGRSADPMTLDVWDLRLSESGAKVLAHRRRVLADLDPHLAEAYRLVGARSNLTWRYGSTWVVAEAEGIPAIQQALQDALVARRDRDMDQRVTRDELVDEGGSRARVANDEDALSGHPRAWLRELHQRMFFSV